jgi:hypothetical protein
VDPLHCAGLSRGPALASRAELYLLSRSAAAWSASAGSDRWAQIGSGGSRQTSPVAGLWRSHRNRRWAAWVDTPSAAPISAHVQPASMAVATASSRCVSLLARRAETASSFFNAVVVIVRYQHMLTRFVSSACIGRSRSGAAVAQISGVSKPSANSG